MRVVKRPALFGKAADSIWAADFGGTILHWDGPPDPSTLWTAGEGGLLLRRDGDAWVRQRTDTTGALFGLKVRANGEVWVVGARGMILRRAR